MDVNIIYLFPFNNLRDILVFISLLVDI